MVMVMVVVVREDEAGRKGAGYGIKKQNLTQGVRKNMLTINFRPDGRATVH